MSRFAEIQDFLKLQIRIETIISFHKSGITFQREFEGEITFSRGKVIKKNGHMF